jgi:hypothetical protein
MKQEELGFDGLGDEDEEIYDEDNEDYDDADALSSSPSIPDDVRSTPSISNHFTLI